MSFFTKGITSMRTPDTKESLIKFMLNSEDLELKTEIPHVLAMSVFDLITIHYMPAAERAKVAFAIQTITKGGVKRDKMPKDITPGDYLNYIRIMYRKNAVSHNRESRREVGGMLQSIESGEDKKRKFIEGLLGG